MNPQALKLLYPHLFRPGKARYEKNFKEKDHPRDHGKFAEKPGSGGGATADDAPKPATPKKPKAKRGTLAAAVKEGRGKDGVIKLADGEPAPPHVQEYIQRIQPGWTDLQVSLDPDADVIASGKDEKGRPQVVYADSYTMRTTALKFERTREMLEKAADIHQANQENRTKSETKEAADAVWLMELQGTRPGSDKDTGADKEAFGATNLRAEHVIIDGDEVRLEFTGKKGVDQQHVISDPELAAMLKERKKTAKKRSGKLFGVNEGQVNRYIKKSFGGFSAKDFRTKRANEIAIEAVNAAEAPTNEKEYKERIKAVSEQVAHVLGNRPAESLKSYIDPTVFAGWKAAADIPYVKPEKPKSAKKPKAKPKTEPKTEEQDSGTPAGKQQRELFRKSGRPQLAGGDGPRGPRAATGRGDHGGGAAGAGDDSGVRPGLNLRGLKAAYPHFFRYAKKKPVKPAAKAEPAAGGEDRWITIGGKEGEKGKHEGGFPVLIGSDGTIKASRVGGLHGKKVGEVKGHFDQQRGKGKQQKKEPSPQFRATGQDWDEYLNTPIGSQAARDKLDGLKKPPAKTEDKPAPKPDADHARRLQQASQIEAKAAAPKPAPADDDFQLEQQSAKGKPKFKHELTDAGAGNTKQQAMFDTRKTTPGQGEMFETDYEIQDREQQQKHAEGSGLDTPAELKRKQALGESLKGKEEDLAAENPKEESVSFADTRKVNQWTRANLHPTAKVYDRKSGQITIGAEPGADLHQFKEKLESLPGVKSVNTPGLKNYLDVRYDQNQHPSPPKRKQTSYKPQLPGGEDMDDATLVPGGSARSERHDFARNLLLKFKPEDRRQLNVVEEKTALAFMQRSTPEGALRQLRKQSPGIFKNKLGREAVEADIQRLFKEFGPQKYSRRTSPTFLQAMYPHFFRRHIPHPAGDT